MNTVLNDEILSVGKGFTKKDASQIAAQAALEKLGI
jgi:ribonuclease-3